MCPELIIIININILITSWTLIHTLKCILIQILKYPLSSECILERALSTICTDLLITILIPEVLALTNTLISVSNLITGTNTVNCLFSVSSCMFTITILHRNLSFILNCNIILITTMITLWYYFINILILRGLKMFFLQGVQNNYKNLKKEVKISF